MNNSIKILSFALIFVVFGGGSVIPNIAVADHSNVHTIEQLQSQVEQLLLQIKVLQQQQISETLTKPNFVPAEPVSKPTPPATPACPIFSYNLIRGVSDKDTEGEVTKLQKILAADSTVYPEGLVTGYYGSLTEKAVQRWQAKQGIISSGSAVTTGYGVVGQKTREKFISVCPVPQPIPPTDSVVTVLSPNGGERWALGSNQTIQWSSSQWYSKPSTNPVEEVEEDDKNTTTKIAFVDIDLWSWSIPCKKGETCSMAPSSFVALAKKVANNGSFQWSVGKNLSEKSMIPTGLYVIRISNSENLSQYDQSNAAFSIVKESDGNLPPSISGVSGPSILKVGEIGKWEVKAIDPEQGSLAYSVVWGDEIVGAGIAERAVSLSDKVSVQTATFTHVYSKAGVYTPVFIVTDNGGFSAKTSISVSVGEITSVNKLPVINGIPSIPSDIKIDQLVSFSWSATDADGDDLSWSVSWGDGTAMAGTCRSSNPQNKKNWNFTSTHSWVASGIYTVKATVNDCRGGSDGHSFLLTVN